MQIKYIYWLLIAVILVAMPAAFAAGQSAVLDSLIRQAEANNPDLQTAEHNLRAARSMAKSEGWLPDPDFMIGFMDLPRSSLALNQDPMSGISVGISQKIPWPGKLANMRDLANLQVDEYGYTEKAWRNSLIKEVKSSYYEYSYWSLAGDVIDDNIVLMRQLVEVARTKYANGEGLAQDVLNAQTSLSKLEDRKLDIDKMKKSALAMLNILLNEPAYEPKIVPAFLSEASVGSLPVDSLVNAAYGRNPGLKISDVRLSQAQTRKSLAKSDYWPELMVGFEYRFRQYINNGMAMGTTNGEDFVSASAGLSLPLWFWKTQSNKLAAAREDLAAAQAMNSSDRLKVEYQITEAVLEIERKYQSYEFYKSTIIPQTESALESANIAYQVGKADFLNLITAQMDLLESRMDQLSMLKDYNVQLAALDELVGEQIARQLK